MSPGVTDEELYRLLKGRPEASFVMWSCVQITDKIHSVGQRVNAYEADLVEARMLPAEEQHVRVLELAKALDGISEELSTLEAYREALLEPYLGADPLPATSCQVQGEREP